MTEIDGISRVYKYDSWVRDNETVRCLQELVPVDSGLKDFKMQYIGWIKIPKAPIMGAEMEEIYKRVDYHVGRSFSAVTGRAWTASEPGAAKSFRLDRAWGPEEHQTLVSDLEKKAGRAGLTIIVGE